MVTEEGENRRFAVDRDDHCLGFVLLCGEIALQSASSMAASTIRGRCSEMTSKVINFCFEIQRFWLFRFLKLLRCWVPLRAGATIACFGTSSSSARQLPLVALHFTPLTPDKLEQFFLASRTDGRFRTEEDTQCRPSRP